MTVAQLSKQFGGHYLPGPQFTGGISYGAEVKVFLSALESDPALEFAEVWASSIRDGELPSWMSLQPHKVPHLLDNVFMVDRRAGDQSFAVRFIGERIANELNFDNGALAAEHQDRGDLVEQWMGALGYSADSRAVGLARIDGRLSGHSTRKMTAVTFPLTAPAGTQQVCGYCVLKH